MRMLDGLQSVMSFCCRSGAKLLLAVFALVSMLCSAQHFPTKTVPLVVPNPPGGGIDIQGRVYANKLQELWKQNVIVEYKAGGGTLLGMDFTAKAVPDGHTICLVATPLVIIPALQPKMPYDTLRDLAGVTLSAVSPFLIGGSPTLEANNIADLDLMFDGPELTLDERFVLREAFSDSDLPMRVDVMDAADVPKTWMIRTCSV